MSQNKTVFQFQVNANMASVDNIIRSWLTAHQFKFEPKPNANYFAYNDPWIMGKRGFEYYINGNTVTILAYIGTFENPTELEGFVGSVGKQGYRNDLDPLFAEIKKLENGGAVNAQPFPGAQPAPAPVVQPIPGAQSSPTPTAQPTQAPAQNGSLNTFMEQNNKKQENIVIVGFILSLIGLLASCIGAVPGGILILIEFYCGCQGLKSGKKGLAIATIVLASISVLIMLFSIALTVLMA